MNRKTRVIQWGHFGYCPRTHYH